MTPAKLLDNKRVVFVFPSLKLGGAERQGLLLARNILKHTSAKVEVWSLGPGEQVAELCGAEGIPVRVLSFSMWTTRFKLLRQLLSFACTLRRARVDILLPYVMQQNLLCGATWRLGGASNCLWQQRDAGQDRGPRLLERLALWQTPHFVANSSPGIDYLQNTLGVPAAKTNFVRNGVEMASAVLSPEQWRARLDVPKETFLACMVANITTAKDHDTLLRAWRLVQDGCEQTGTKAVLLLAGRFGDGEHAAKALAYDLELGQSVRFLGAVEDVTGLLETCDLCTFSSEKEGCPNGVLEAMACGLPVVGTDIPGIRDAVGERGYKHLVALGDAEGFSQCILKLMENEKDYSDYGRMCQERIAACFAPQSMCEGTLAIVSGRAG